MNKQKKFGLVFEEHLPESVKMFDVPVKKGSFVMEKTDKTVSVLNSEYVTIRAGRANPHILDKVTVEYYGSMTPLNQMGNISVPEARILQINIWDLSQIKNVSKAIAEANLGVNPIDDGKTIRLIFPALTEERRKEIVKQVKKISEDSKVAIRNARRDCLDIFKNMKKESEITEDDLAYCEKEVQKITDNFIKKIDELTEEKEKEVMEI